MTFALDLRDSVIKRFWCKIIRYSSMAKTSKMLILDAFYLKCAENFSVVDDIKETYTHSLISI